jgi:hypothetical protein
MLALRVARPLVVVIATSASLWGLAEWTGGFGWIEIIAWDTLLYAISYMLFSWIARYAKTVPVLIVIITIVVLIKITTTL